MDSIIRDIAEAEAKIEEIRNSTTYAEAYKVEQIPLLQQYIADQRDQLAGYYKAIDQKQITQGVVPAQYNDNANAKVVRDSVAVMMKS